MDFSGITQAGTVTAINGYYQGDSVAGHSTRFESFTVPPLSNGYGPVDGTMEHIDDGFIGTHRSRVNLSDAVIEANFFNPYSTSIGSWDYGFLFRRSDSNVFHGVGLRSNGYWYHNMRTGTVELDRDMSSQLSSVIDRSASGNNHLRLIALGSVGWLFINDSFIGKLNLSDLVQPGDVVATTGYYEGNAVVGQSTRFEDFTVWAPQ